MCLAIAHRRWVGAQVSFPCGFIQVGTVSTSEEMSQTATCFWLNLDRGRQWNKAL